MNTTSKIKVIGSLSVEVADKILKQLNKLEGITFVEYQNDYSIISYGISEHASDYDIMVMILNVLTENGVEGEPLFDDELESAIKFQRNLDDDEICDDEGEKRCNCNHEHHHEHHHEHESSVIGCSCCDNEHQEYNYKKERTIKIIELSISLAFLIGSIILSFIEATKDFSRYVAVIAYAVAGYETLINGVTAIFKKKPFNERFLMSVASISAIFLGEYIEAAGIMLLFSIGELFEFGASQSANEVIEKLKSYKPQTARVISEDNFEKTVKPEAVKVGDVLLVRAGEKVVVDGIIIEGEGAFDTKIITGESVYKDLGVDSVVLSGFALFNGTCKIKATKTYGDSAVANIEKVVKNAREKKAKPEKFLEKFAKWYTPIIVCVAVLLALIPPFFYPYYPTGIRIWGLRAVMLLCISCPCSLVLSIPLAYFIGVGNCAEKGIIVKNTAVLEKLSNCKIVVFDKTGTLTSGNLKVEKILSTKKFQGKVLNYINICEMRSNHPIAHAIREKAGVTNVEVTNYIEVAGKGVSLIYDNQKLICGNEKFLIENGVIFNRCDEIGIKLYLAVDNEYAGVVILSDTVRDTARGCMLELYDAGVNQTIMLTGDNKDYAVAVRKQLKMNKSVSELLPEEKVTELEEIIKNSNGTSVAFVGDGVNDAPVLTRADVGISMGNGADVSLQSSDVVLTNSDLSKVPYLIKVAKRTQKIAKINLFTSLIIKLVVFVLSVCGLVESLWLAIGADVGLLVLTILNSIRNKFNAR